VHWHHDTFDLPAGAVLLASSERYPHQAFRVGTHAYGLQFHVEVDADITVRAGHTIAHRVKDRLLASGLRIEDVVVHIEPNGE